MNISSVWEDCLENVKGLVSPQHFDTWFKPINLVEGDEKRIKLEVPNRFFLEWIKEHYLPLLKDVLRKVTGMEPELVWKVSNEDRTAKQEKISSQPKRRPSSTSTGATGPRPRRRGTADLNPRYTFENFVVGKANEFAHAACSAVAKNPASKYNPLFIYGGVGLGKTHLLQAIGHKVLELSGSFKVCYYTSERFMNDFINFVSRQKMSDFRGRFRNVDLLLIDDIQFWKGKERTQEEFFHTFNTLYEAHKQIVVTSDKFPKDIDGLEERLRSRFEWGLVADIQPPDVETKIAILKKKSINEGVELPDEVASWLASVSGSNVRELEGYLNRIIAVSSLTNQDISLSMAKEALKNLVRDRGEKNLTIEEIQKAVANYYHIKLTDIRSKRRHKTIALPRQVAMYLAREYGKFSYPEIGYYFGGKDHSTAIHAVKKIEKELERDPDLKSSIKVIKGFLGVC